MNALLQAPSQPSERSAAMRYLALTVRGSLKIAIGGILTAFFIVPMLWAVLAPFQAAPTYALRVPQSWTIEHFAALFANETAMRSLGNSLLLSGSVAVATVVLGSVAAYAFSRGSLPHANTVTYSILLVSSVGTGTAAMVPLFQLMNDIGLIDQQIGVILVLTSTALPAAIFIVKDFMDGIPKSYEESARLLGRRPLGVLVDIVLPLARPGIAFIAVWALQQAWSDFLVPFLLLRQADKQPAAVMMYTFYTEGGQANLGMLTAFAVLYSAPVVILYLIVSRKWGFHIGGGLKG
jgi:multiple sugar transport system permease protein